MSFSNPVAILWALLGIPIVIFYLMKVRTRREVVATTMFWQQVHDENTARSIRQQLRHLLSLLLQLFFLALLVLALTDPFRATEVRSQRRLVAILDVSASMQAQDENGETRFQNAVKRVQELIASMSANDELALIAGGLPTKVVCGMTSHQRTLQESLNSITVTDGLTGIPEAVAVGNRLVTDRANGTSGRLLIFSDGNFPEAAALQTQEDIVWTQLGQSAANVGITQFQVRRSLDDLTGFQLLTTVSNFGPTSVSCKLDLSLGPQLLDVLPLQLQAGETWRRVFEQTAVAGGILTATLRFDTDNDVDALATDNIAMAVLPERNRTPVTLVTQGSWFLQRALEANEAVDLTIVDVMPTTLPPDAILILHRDVPKIMPPGNVFVVDPSSSTDLWRVEGKVSDPLVSRQQPDSELLRHVRLDNVLMPAASRLVPTVESDSLVESIGGEPLYLQLSRDEGHILVLPVDLDQGDLPLRTAFPILLTNALNWLTDRDGPWLPALSTSTVRTITLPTGMWSRNSNGEGVVTLTAPDGQTSTVSVRDGKSTVGPLHQSGIWKISAAMNDLQADPQPLEIACNLMDADESNLQLTAVQSAADAIGRPTNRRSERALWYSIALLALFVTVVEWFMFQRRWIA